MHQSPRHWLLTSARQCSQVYRWYCQYGLGFFPDRAHYAVGSPRSCSLVLWRAFQSESDIHQVLKPNGAARQEVHGR
jgi:hypothetical protein